MFLEIESYSSVLSCLPPAGPRWATSRPRLASKVTPSPHPGHGAYKGTLWDPLAKIAGALVAGNSNLKLGDTPVLPVVRWQHLIPGTAVDPGPRVPPRIV